MFNRLISVLVLVSFSTGCGFHLRGNVVMPASLNNVHIIGGEADFNEGLAAELKRAGSNVVATDKDSATLRIDNLAYLNSVSKTDASGRATGYTYHYTLEYSVVDANANVLQAPVAIHQERTQEYDPNQVLQAEQEEAFLKEEMEKDLVLQLVRRLSRL